MAENSHNLLLSSYKKMMKDCGRIARRSSIFKQDIKDFGGKVILQWNVCGILGYQIFTENDYIYEIGKKIENPDLEIRIKNPKLAIRFLNGEDLGFHYVPRKDYKGKFKLNYIDNIYENDKEKRIPRKFLTAQSYNEKFKHPFNLLKLPPFQRTVKLISRKKEFGAYIPINQSLGKYENMIIPYAVFKHFIEKASNIVMMNYCLCRRFSDCQNHNHSLGCMYMGDDTLQMNLNNEEKYHVATKEEALERVRRAIADGLIPVLGRSMGEAEGNEVKDTGHFLASCFCCSCCCINGKLLTYGPNANLTMFSRIEGLSVKINEDLCQGCGTCLTVCVFKGRKIVNGKAKVDPTRCLGCGRCEMVCPNGATTIVIDDRNRIDELINKIEEYVDVRNQSLA
ncbi:MAG: indolepyruvate ferredoxin oxidoreductase subunit alpha [Promethearchaeota archaeon]